MKKRNVLLLAVSLVSLMAAGCGKNGPAVDGDKAGGRESGSGRSEVVNIHGSVSHLDRMDAFVEKASRGENASVRVTQYTIEGDPIYFDLTAKEGRIDAGYDTSKDKFGGSGPKVTTYSCARIERTETTTSLAYTLRECKGNGDSRTVLQLAFDVEKQDRFEFALRFGPNFENEIDTINRSLRKDLGNGQGLGISDYTPASNERQQIYRAMVLANYLTEKKLTTKCTDASAVRYELQVSINSASRSYAWAYCDTSEDGRTMTSLAKQIQDIVKFSDLR
jgi:hypothetical protein